MRVLAVPESKAASNKIAAGPLESET
jgi:hypothetical protein